MRFSHDSARKDGDPRNLKVAPVHKISRKPECGKTQHVAEAAHETMEPDLATAETLQDTMQPDLTTAEETLDTTDPDLTMVATLLDTMEPDLLATHEAANPPDEELRIENLPNWEFRTRPPDERGTKDLWMNEAPEDLWEEAPEDRQEEAPEDLQEEAREDLQAEAPKDLREEAPEWEEAPQVEAPKALRMRQRRPHDETPKPSGRGTQALSTKHPQDEVSASESPQDEASKDLRTRHPKTSGRGTPRPLDEAPQDLRTRH